METILVTGVGGPTPIGIAKSLKLANPGVRLVGTDASRFAPGLYRNDLFEQTCHVPLASDKEYWPVISKIVEKEKIDYAFVVPETEVLAWCHRKKEKNLPCKALLPEPEIASFLYDKLNVSKSLEPHGLAPKTIVVSSQMKFNEIGTELGYPYWVREKAGAGAIGSFKIDSQQDIENWLSVNPENAQLIASTFLPGRNYACKLLFKEGKLVMAASGERVEYLLANAAPSGISGMCARGRLLNSLKLEERSIHAVEIIHKNLIKFHMECLP